MNYRKLWIGFIVVLVVSFAGLGYMGVEIYQQSPPIPVKYISKEGKTIITDQEIKDGQNVWESIGGQETGSIWGHGSYVAPDWSADWLHREAVFILDTFAKEVYNKPYNEISEEQQAGLKVRLQKELRTNTYDPKTGNVTLSDVEVKAFQEISKHYNSLFTNDPKFEKLREAYAVPANAIKDPSRLKPLNSFFFWTSWTASTNRPGEEITYTNNWPHEELVANKPTGSLILWTGFSVILLLAGIGGLAAYYAKNKDERSEPEFYPEKDPLLN